jgi:hypothetical protein
VAATLQELVDVQHNEVNDRFPNAMLLSLPKPTELDRVSEAQLQTLAGATAPAPDSGWQFLPGGPAMSAR